MLVVRPVEWVDRLAGLHPVHLTARPSVTSVVLLHMNQIPLPSKYVCRCCSRNKENVTTAPYQVRMPSQACNGRSPVLSGAVETFSTSSAARSKGRSAAQTSSTTLTTAPVKSLVSLYPLIDDEDFISCGKD